MPARRGRYPATWQRATPMATPGGQPQGSLMFALGRWYLLAGRLGRFLCHPATRYVLTWLVAVAAAWQCTANSWDAFNKDSRPDGNDGHTAIDFGGQWIMGRMLVTGQGQFLYERNHLRNELIAGYP